MYTRPKHEKKIYTRLTEMKVNSFLPLRKQLRTWHDRRKYIDEPLFPSYVFIYLNSMQQYYDGMDTDGVMYYVRTGKEIARVSDTVVDNIKLLVNKAGELEVSDQRFLPGRRLVISNGPLTGLSCEVVRCDDKDKLLVRVDLLQRNILLSIPEKSLLPV
jgi:transcription antitermination factor NusG